MKQIRKVLTDVLVLLCMAVTLSGCNGSDQDEVRMIPFKSDEDGKWGMITTQGKVVFEKEFRNPPTYVTDDRFFVQNQDGFWELYTAEESPKRIGDEFRYASPFSNGSAMVTPRNGCVTIIDKDAKPVAELENFEEKSVTRASSFIGRNAVVVCSDTLYGVINVKGKTVVKPEYSYISLLPDGLMIANDYPYQSTHMSPYDTIQKGTQFILDRDGKEKFKIDGRTYWCIVENAVTDKYVTVKSRTFKIHTEHNGNESFTWPEAIWSYSVMDYEGEIVHKAAEDEKQILAIRGEDYIFTNEDNLVGVRDFEGNTVVPAEYNGINFIGENYIAAQKNGDESNEYRHRIRLLDKDGQQLSHSVFSVVAGNDNYRRLEGNYVFAKEEKENWVVLNDKGEKISDLPELFEMLPCSWGDMDLMTDKVDYAKLFAGIRLTSTSFAGFNFLMGPKEAIQEQQKFWNATTDLKEKPKASDYGYMQDLYIYGNVDGASYSGEIHFPSTLSRQTYSQKKVIDYTYGYYYWYHMENIPTGYVFNNITPQYFKLSFSQWNYYGKLRSLYKALAAYCKDWGEVEDSNSGATLINLKDGRTAVISLSPDEVVLKWGKLPGEDKWIGQYSDVAEKLVATYEGNEYFANQFNDYCSTGDCDEEGD